MEPARRARENPQDFQEAVLNALFNIDATLLQIHAALTGPARSKTDQDIEDLAIYYLHQGSGNVSDVVRQLKNAGFHVRRPSLTKAKKFRRFQKELRGYARDAPRRGYQTDEGIEAID